MEDVWIFFKIKYKIQFFLNIIVEIINMQSNERSEIPLVEPTRSGRPKKYGRERILGDVKKPSFFCYTDINV